MAPFGMLSGGCRFAAVLVACSALAGQAVALRSTSGLFLAEPQQQSVKHEFTPTQGGSSLGHVAESHGQQSVKQSVKQPPAVGMLPALPPTVMACCPGGQPNGMQQMLPFQQPMPQQLLAPPQQPLPLQSTPMQQQQQQAMMPMQQAGLQPMPPAQQQGMLPAQAVMQPGMQPMQQQVGMLPMQQPGMSPWQWQPTQPMQQGAWHNVQPWQQPWMTVNKTKGIELTSGAAAAETDQKTKTKGDEPKLKSTTKSIELTSGMAIREPKEHAAESHAES